MFVIVAHPVGQDTDINFPSASCCASKRRKLLYKQDQTVINFGRKCEGPLSIKSRSDEVAETFRLLRAFRALRNPAVRQCIIQMIEAVSARDVAQRVPRPPTDQRKS